jgi:hypothetical protein
VAEAAASSSRVVEASLVDSLVASLVGSKLSFGGLSVCVHLFGVLCFGFGALLEYGNTRNEEFCFVRGPIDRGPICISCINMNTSCVLFKGFGRVERSNGQ